MRSGRLEFEQCISVSRETLTRLERFVELVRQWSPKINLISKASMPEIWIRHVLDSAQILPFAPSSIRHWVDIGSGGGFPAVVIGILAREMHPDLKITLVESDQRKCAFLSTALRETGVKGEVQCVRSEDLEPQMADVVSARAFAPLATLLEHTVRHLAPDGTALFLKGARHDEELINALDSWTFRCETHPSKTDADAVVLRISEIERA